MSSVGDGLWFTIKIIVYSSLFVLLFSRLGNPRPSPERVPRPPAYTPVVAEYGRVARALREEKRLRRQFTTPQWFPFGNLPIELRLAVLAYADNRTLVSLSSVSKGFRYDAFRACLPRLAIRLTTRRQLLSFDRFCFENPSHVQFVHHMWISPSEEEDRFPSHRIITHCTNIKSLACDTWLLVYGLCSEGEMKHRDCKKLTLLKSQSIRGDPPPLVQPHAPIFGQLTHIRIVDTAIPKSVFSNLTHFSYVCARGAEAQCTKMIGNMIRKKEERFPQLRMVVVTQKWRGDAQAYSLDSKEQGFRVIVYYTPDKETDIWRDGVMGKSIWDKAK